MEELLKEFEDFRRVARLIFYELEPTDLIADIALLEVACRLLGREPTYEDVGVWGEELLASRLSGLRKMVRDYDAPGGILHHPMRARTNRKRPF